MRYRHVACFILLLGCIALQAQANPAVIPTGLAGVRPHLATGPDGSLHLVYFAEPGKVLSYAKLVGNNWTGTLAVPGGEQACKDARFNQPALAVDPQSQPHLVWGAHPHQAKQGIKGIWYWAGGPKAKKVFDGYLEYVTLAVTASGVPYLVAGNPELPGESGFFGVAWAKISNGAASVFKRITVPKGQAEGKEVFLCAGDDGSLHLTWRFTKTNYVRFDGGAWGVAESLEVGSSPRCTSGPGGSTHLVGLNWKQLSKGFWRPLTISYRGREQNKWQPSTNLVVHSFPSDWTGLTDGWSEASIARSPSGEVVIVWTENENLMLARSGNGGKSFGNGVVLHSELKPTNEATPVVFHAGAFVVVYTRKDGQLVRAVIPPDVAAPLPPDGGAGGGPDGSLTSDGAVPASDGLSDLPTLPVDAGPAEALVPAPSSDQGSAPEAQGTSGCELVGANALGSPIVLCLFLFVLVGLFRRARHQGLPLG
jgi:hypothetical protein